MHDTVHYTSKSEEWATPQAFFDRLNDEFNFTLDASADAENAKCNRYFTKEQNGLAQSWKGERVWLNPPYGRGIGQWIDKAMNSEADIVCCLIPAKTETRWWAKFWDYEIQRPITGCEVRFVFGRIQYGDSGINAPFPNAVVIFRNDMNENVICDCGHRKQRHDFHAWKCTDCDCQKYLVSPAPDSNSDQGKGDEIVKNQSASTA